MKQIQAWNNNSEVTRNSYGKIIQRMRPMNMDSSFVETEQYFNNLLSKKIDENLMANFKSYMKGLPNGNGITTKYMLEMMKVYESKVKRKNSRINKVLLKSGYTKEIMFGNDGFLKKIISVEEFLDNKVLLKNRLLKLMDKLQQDKVNRDIEDQKWNLFETEYKKKHDEEYTIVKNCPNCDKIMRFPSLKDDQEQGFANGIYNFVWSGIMNHTKFCGTCQTISDRYDGWNVPKIKQDLTDAVTKLGLESGKVLGIEVDDDFFIEYRFDKQVKTLDEAKSALRTTVKECSWKRLICKNSEDGDGMETYIIV
ncbi:hypothetical protein M0R04_08710 [Candidatus Dojkabacteria bacterium]|nr:hypothetical protein [Candidatus Dojkabacteria bacterium]